MNFTVLTIFPDMFIPFREHGIIRRALEQSRISLSIVNLRDFALDKHHVTDDRPYGGGCGMVMKAEPLIAAIRAAKRRHPSAKTMLLSPQGRVLTQKKAHELALSEGLVFVCGRYEGVDERIVDFTDEEISIGDYVLTGGELAVMVIIDAVARLIPGVLGGETSAEKDSFSDGLLEHAHYTRPRTCEGDAVPEVLLSGNHKEIEKWRLESAVVRTFLKRPDLLENRPLSQEERAILKKWGGHVDRILQAQSSCRADSSSGGQQEQGADHICRDQLGPA